MKRRLPAEWEPHAATWLAWPHNESTWPGVYDRVPADYAAFVRSVRRFEPVRLLVPDESVKTRLRERDDLEGEQPLELVVLPTNDAWIRDYGPLFVAEEGGLVATSWRFDSWGGKYPSELDDRAGDEIARRSRWPRERLDRELEGGSLTTDGAGTLLTTTSCLLRSQRRPRLARPELEALLAEKLGVERFLWLEEGIAGDDTDGHVDDFARFVAPDTLVVARAAPEHPDHAALEAAVEFLRAARRPDGRPYRLVALPVPPELRNPAGERLPASYANFIFVNGGLLVPTFGAPRDAEALEVLAALCPDREVVGLDTSALIHGLGGLHCLSLEEPAGPGES